MIFRQCFSKYEHNPTRIRTRDLRFKNPILLQLSYMYDDIQPNRLVQTSLQNIIINRHLVT